VTQLVFYAKFFAAICISLLIGISSSEAGFQSLESSLSSLISAIIGGVISSLAFSFVILAQAFKKTNPENTEHLIRYRAVTQSLLSDVRLLVWCLAGAVFAPLIRHTNMPILSYPERLTPFLSRDQIITSIEIFLVIASISILFEVCHCMFHTFIHDSNQNKN
jgi:hypothetical protein